MVKAAAKTRRAKASREDASGDGQLHGRLFYSLKHAQGRARAALDEAFGQIGLTTPQFLALNAIDENARSSSAELARHSYVSPQAMMTIIARLESSGLIARTPDPQGGRSLETALTQKGVSREDAYAWVQRDAMPVWRGEGDFLSLLKADADVARVLTVAELEALFDLGYHLKHVDTIFARVFGDLQAR